jgi:hypothetical protein
MISNMQLFTPLLMSTHIILRRSRKTRTAIATISSVQQSTHTQPSPPESTHQHHRDNMLFDPFALAAIIILILLLPFMLFILAHIARRSGQDEWDRAENGRHRNPPKRPYTQRYVDALDGEPGFRRPRVRTSRSMRRSERMRQPAFGSVVAAGRSAEMTADDDGDGDDVREGRFAVLGLHVPPPDMFDQRPARADDRTRAFAGRGKVECGFKIDELWFDGV